jgi:multidrug efflux pump subunit AcrB
MKEQKQPLETLLMRNKHLLILTIAVILVAGFSALSSMARLEDPVITNRNPLIITRFPGATAERVEALVTEKIEDSLQEVAEIKEINSTSRAGVSVVAIELKDGVNADSNEEVFSLIRDKLSEAERQFPSQVLSPFFDDKRGAVAYTLVTALTWSHASRPQLGTLNRLAEDLADRLRNFSGTELVRVFGEPEEEITVTIDPAELAALGLNSADVAARIAAADSKVPAGFLRGTEADLPIEVSGELATLQRVRSVPLREGADGTLIRIGHIASVNRDWQEPPAEIALSDGRHSVFVAARVQKDRRVDRWSSEADLVVKQFAAGVGEGIEVERVFDQSRYTKGRLGELGMNLALGAIVVMAVVFVFMGWRASLLVGSALPLVAALTLFGVSLIGGALHQMSIFGMIIALGLLIDNAIVMVDETRKHMSAGITPQQAVSRAIRHLIVPLFSSTLTTVLAFMPILLLPGNIGDFIGLIGGSVVIALISSFFVAIAIISSLTGLFGRVAPKDRRLRWWCDGLSSPRLAGLFQRGLLLGLKRPLATVALVCLLPALGLLLGAVLKSEFFPRTDRDMFEVRVWLPTESSIHNTYRNALEIEAELMKYPEIQHMHWLIGGSFPSVYYNLVMNQDDASHFGHAIVKATSSKAVRRLIPDIQKTLDRKFPGAQIMVNQFAQGPPSDADIELRIFGPSVPVLQDLGEAVRLRVAEHPDVLHSRVSMARGEPKLWLDADENEARLAGITLTDLSQQLQGSLEGFTGGSIVEDLEEMPVRIRYENSRRTRLAHIGSINFVSPSNPEDWIPLSALGQLKLRPELGGITRRNGLRSNTISGYVRNEALPLEVTKEIVSRLEAEGLKLPAGYRLEIGGYSENQGEAVGNLTLYLPVLMTLIAATLILSFKSLALALTLGVIAIMSAGFGLLATWVAGYPVSFNSILGLAGLIGLAFNDSIVVMAAIRANPDARAGNRRAIVEQVMGSMRHIISTTLTTIGGFLPLLLFIGGDFWPPLAIVLAGGVGGSTMLAVVFVPAAYRLLACLRCLPFSLPLRTGRRLFPSSRQRAGQCGLHHGDISHLQTQG